MQEKLSRGEMKSIMAGSQINNEFCNWVGQVCWRGGICQQYADGLHCVH